MVDADRGIEPRLDAERSEAFGHQRVFVGPQRLVERPGPVEDLPGERQPVGLVRTGRTGPVPDEARGVDEIQPRLRRTTVGHVARHRARHRAVPGPVQRDAAVHPIRARHAVGFEEGHDLALRHPDAEVAHPPGIEAGRPFGHAHLGVPLPNQVTGAIASRRGHDDLEGLIALLLEEGAHGAQDGVFVAVPEDHRREDRVLLLCGHDPLSNEVMPGHRGPRKPYGRGFRHLGGPPLSLAGPGAPGRSWRRGEAGSGLAGPGAGRRDGVVGGDGLGVRG